MLVITDIFEDNRKLPSTKFALLTRDKDYIIYVMSKKYPTSFNDTTFNILDTDTGKKELMLSMEQVLNLMDKNILGLVVRKHDIIFIALDAISWKIINYINEVKYLGKLKGIGLYFKDKFSSVKLIERKHILMLADSCKFICDSKLIYSFELKQGLQIIDEYGVFWGLGVESYTTIKSIYDLITLVDDIDKCDEFFVSDTNNNLYRFEINADIIRLITKIKVFGENKVDW